MIARARLMVDPIACDGRGICAELLPGLITLDDWGFPIIQGDVRRPCGMRPPKPSGCAPNWRCG